MENNSSLHNYKQKYPFLDIVYIMDGDEKVHYIAKQDVPRNTKITDTRYWQPIDIAGGDPDYANIRNKPTINGVEVSGEMTSEDLGVYSKPDNGIPESDLAPEIQIQLNKHFKGWYDSSSNLPANPVVGDYAYVKGTTSSDPAAIYECATAGTWSDSGRTVNTSSVQTFADGQEVNDVHIVDDMTTGGSDDVLSAEQGKNIYEAISINENIVYTTIEGLYITADSTIGSYDTAKIMYFPIKAGESIKIIGRDAAMSNFRMGISSNIPEVNSSVTGLEQLPGGTSSFTQDYIAKANGYFCIGCLNTYNNISFIKQYNGIRSYDTVVELDMRAYSLDLGGISCHNRDNYLFNRFGSPLYKLNNANIINISGNFDESIETIHFLKYNQNCEYLGYVNSFEQLSIDSPYYFAISIIKNSGIYNYKRKVLKLTYKAKTNIERVYFGYPNQVKFLSFEVSRIDSLNANDEAYSGNTQRCFSNGYIVLPPNYDRNGSPVPLAIFCHGTGGYDFYESTIKYYEDLIKFVAKNGYAVIDCCTTTSLYSNSFDTEGNRRTNYRDTNYPCRLSIEAYVSFYKNICDMYNVDKNRVYIWGKSSGGRLAALLGNNNYIPVKAIGILNGSTDSMIDFRALGYESRQSVAKMMTDYQGFSDIPESFFAAGVPFFDPANIPSDLKNYLIDNLDKIEGYNPIFTAISNFDASAYESAAMSCDLTFPSIKTSLTDNSDITNQVNNAFKTCFTPTKLWATKDDANVPYPCSVIYYNLLKKGGAICELRTMPEGCGQHWAVDNLVSGYSATGTPPVTNYTTKFGEVCTNIAVAYCELVDWFNQW